MNNSNLKKHKHKLQKKHKHKLQKKQTVQMMEEYLQVQLLKLLQSKKELSYKILDKVLDLMEGLYDKMLKDTQLLLNKNLQQLKHKNQKKSQRKNLHLSHKIHFNQFH